MVVDDGALGPTVTDACPYMRWEEVQVSGDRGRRVVHYYAKDALGRSDLAVVGREKSVRHMSYDIVDSFLRRLALMGGSPSSSSSHLPPFGFPGRLRSRREVVDWLSSLVSDSPSDGSMDRYLDDEDDSSICLSFSKGLSSRKMRHHSKDFSWLGSPKCRRRRNHYSSFCRNGITISVHDFVYIMGEDNKRFIAHVEDMYEDFKSGNMVLVRWFHKVDEVGIGLPSDTDDKEVFFTRYYQDLSIECIDGLAVVLGSKHFEKYGNDTANITWELYLCRREINYDSDITSFDITQVPGYWNQEFLRYTCTASTHSDLEETGNGPDLTSRSKRKNVLSSSCEVTDLTCRNKEGYLTVDNGIVKNVRASCLPGKEAFKQKFQQQLSSGCQVEVLCQDSGIRGCWFRGVILNKCNDKVNVQYKDLQDADGTGNLKEWVPASKIATPDKFGIRLKGRTVIRPHVSLRSNTKSFFNVGSVVDAWWHEGWWEGIITHRESDHKFHVYFPGERRSASFDEGELRHSLEYMQGKWNPMECRPDLVCSLLANQELVKDGKGSQVHASSQTSPSYRNQSGFKISQNESLWGKSDSWGSDEEKKKDVEEFAQAPLCHFKWGSSRKRSRSTDSKSGITFKRPCNDRSDSGTDVEKVDADPCVCFRHPLTQSFTTDPENCKVGGDIMLFNPPVSVTNLVMTR